MDLRTSDVRDASDRERFWTGERVAQATRSCALLATVGASLALFAVEASGNSTWLDRFLVKNEMPLPVRHRILLAMAGTGTLLALPAAALLLRRPTAAALDAVRRAALMASPLALFALLLPLLRIRPWEDDPLSLACAGTVVVVLVERTTRWALEATPPAVVGWLRRGAKRGGEAVGPLGHRVGRALPVALVTVGALAYGAFTTYFTVRYNRRLGTAAFDLGSLDNIFFNTLRGHPLRGTVQIPTGGDWSDLRVHTEFSTFAFLPFYALRPGAETLLAMQAFVVGLGALPIYLFAARRLPRTSALVLAAAYLLFAPVHSGNFYDAHFQPFASTLLLLSFYFLDTRRDLLFALFFLVALGCREDVSMSLAAAGVLVLATGYRPLAGAIVTLVSATYFVLVRFVVMPRFGTWGFADMYKDLLPSGDSSLLGAMKTVVSNPVFTYGSLLTREKLLHVLRIFLPLAYLPLRRAWLWVGFVPAILGTILTTGYHPTTDTTFQYVFYWVPFIFLGTAVILQQIRQQSGAAAQAAAVVALACGTLVTTLHWGAVLQRKTFASAWGRINLGPLTEAERQSLHDLQDLGAMVPKEASLALSENECPHFSNRLLAYTLRLGVSDADYILYRIDTGGFGADQANEALRSGKYTLLAQRGRFSLLKRNGVP